MATKRGQIYKCELCGNIVEVIGEAAGELVCCGKAMTLLEEKNADSSTEKHVPFVERKDGAYVVRVGENAAHPMTEEHYIQWIELTVDGVSHKKYLNPGDEPKAVFEVAEGKEISAREMCNLHGVWINK